MNRWMCGGVAALGLVVVLFGSTGCGGNKGNARICKSMIQFAQNFERSATAVGIETIEDAQAIMGLGCHFGQGYIFGKPMTDQQLVTMVRTGREKSDSFVSA